ncbi:MAG: phosphoserine phosphatase [Planctomycetota bacterium]|jgi:phosphoserine phosphatase
MIELTPLMEPDWVFLAGGDRVFSITLVSKAPLLAEVSIAHTLLAKVTRVDENSFSESAYRINVNCSNDAAWSLFQKLRVALPDIDIAVAPKRDKPYRLLICDMDMTIVDAETLDEVGHLLGIGEKIATITRKAMRGEINFRQALRERVELLAGQPVSLFEQVLAECRLMPGAENLLEQAKAMGMHSILVSGGFAQIAMPIAQRLGFDEVYCNQLKLDGDRLTGEVNEPMINAEYKCELLKRRAQGLSISLEDCCAIGDGANDIPMIETAGLGIAYHGKPAMRAVTTYQINHTDLSTVIRFLTV